MYEYDRCGRRVAVVDPLGHRWAYRYDGDGRVTQVVAPTGEIERFRYDGAGRLAVRRSPAGGDTRYDYDAAGRVVAVTDPTGGVRRFAYDAGGQLVEATDPNGGVIRYERSVRGWVDATVDPVGGRVEHRYDEMGRMVARTDQLGRTTEWEYDRAGRMTRRVLPTGERVRWWYDDSGRVTGIGAGADAEPTVHIGRDQLARPTIIDEPGFRHELTWDAAGRLVAKRSNDLELTWRYDADGRRVAIGLPDGTETGFEFDAAGRSIAARHPAVGTVAIDRDAAGRCIGIESGRAAQRWRYEDGELVAHEAQRPGGPRVTRLERDPAGRLVAALTDDGTRRYDYDAAGQLVQVDGPDGAWSFGYDRAGRLAHETRPGGDTVTYHHDAAHQLTERRSGAGVTRYDYDAAGRRIAETGPNGSRTFTWDGFGRPAGVGDTRLRVDALGDLAAIDDRALVWDPVAAVPQLRWLDGTTIVGDERPWATIDPNGNVGWLDADVQGSLGGVHDPWGAGPASATGLGYRGELTVDDLVWLRARPYQPDSRSFLSVDPLPGVPGDPFATNPYHYAGNDPIGAVDPLGLRPLTEAELAQHIDSINNNMFERAGDWVADNWEYIAAGALIVAGGAIMLTGVGGPIGAAMIGGALMSGGFSAGSQRLLTGEVNWGRVAIDGAIGGLAGGAGAWAGGARVLTNVNPLLRGGLVGAGENVLGGAATRAAYGQNPFDPRGMTQDVLLGGVTGAGGARLAGANGPPCSGRCCTTSDSLRDLPRGHAEPVEPPASTGRGGAVVPGLIVESLAAPRGPTPRVATRTAIHRYRHLSPACGLGRTRQRAAWTCVGVWRGSRAAPGSCIRTRQVPEMTAADVVDLFARVANRLNDLAKELRSHPAVTHVDTGFWPRSYEDGSTVECYVDAELTSGNAVGFWLEFRYRDGEWIIESSVRQNTALGQDELRGLPTRYATDGDDFFAELESAVALLVGNSSSLDLASL